MGICRFSGPILAWTSRLTHLPIDWSIFAWYVITLFAMLASCWMLLTACFSSPRARWTACWWLTAVLAMPATNTGLLLVDPYMTARSFSTPLTLFALARAAGAQLRAAGAAILFTAAFHPQMVAYLIFLAFVLWAAERRNSMVRERVPAMAPAWACCPPAFISARQAAPTAKRSIRATISSSTTGPGITGSACWRRWRSWPGSGRAICEGHGRHLHP